MKKKTKKRLIGMAWAVGAFLVGKFAWNYFDGDTQVEKLKAKTEG